ncbi:MAG: hypothetical protein MJY69_03175 [Bacteroidales bacterium]|nr:hypothetical protein [Bacteroidales bacterium]
MRLQRGLSGEIISRFEKKGLKLVALKMYRFTKEKCAEHYSHLIGKSFYPIIESSMMAAPVILCCWEGIDAVEGDFKGEIGDAEALDCRLVFHQH